MKAELAEDQGYFGPGSMTWRIMSDPSSWLGGGRALVYQALHPAAMAVFSANTDYHSDPWGRLRRTASYVEATVFSEKARADRAGAFLRGMHARLRGVDPDTGKERRADDHDLLLWIHSTTVESFAVAYDRYAHRLSDEEQDRFVWEMVRWAGFVGLRPAEVPCSMGAMREYLESVDCLRVTEHAEEGMRMILFSPPIPAIFRPLWSTGARSIIALLPPRVREMYGLQWSPVLNPPVRLATFALSRLYNVLIARAMREHFSGRDWTSSPAHAHASAGGS